MGSVITAAQSGNASATATWTGGVVPVAGDEIRLNGFSVAQNVTPFPTAGGSLTELNAKDGAGAYTTGQWTVDLATLGNSALNVTTIRGGTGAASDAVIQVSGAAPAATLTITATTITGGPATNSRAIWNNSTGTVTIAVTTLTSSGTTTRIVQNVSTGTINITATSITGGTSTTRIVDNESTGTINITVTSITGGSGTSAAYGVYNTSTGTINITATSITGGSSTAGSGFGVYNASTGTIILNADCALIYGATSPAYVGPPPTWTPSTAAYWQMGSNKFPLQLAAGKIVTPTVHGNITGTRVDCPTAKALTTSGSYGDPGAPLVGSVDQAALEAAAAAAQLATDQAAVTAKIAAILDTVTILSIGGDYHAPDPSEVWHEAVFGPLSALSGDLFASDIANCSAGNVKDGVMIDDVTGNYGGGGIATPTLAVVDQGDGTGATATIAAGSATATNTVYASQDGTTWTAAGSLVGNGTVDLSLAVGRWWVYVHAVEGAATANSIVHAVNVTSAIADPTPANCLAAVAAAVAVKLNAGKTAAYFARNDFMATVAADTDLLLEAAGSDVLHVDVATGDVKTEYITRASRAFDCRADVCLRIRPSAMTVAERDALSALLGELEDYLKPIGGDPCTLDTYADAIWTASEIRAPWVPDHWRDERQYTGIFSVTFRVYAD